MTAQELQMFLETYGEAFLSVGVSLAAALLSTCVLVIAIRWCIFKKAGQKGWKALIPVYSDYVYYKIAWSGRVYVILLLCSLGSVILGAVATALNQNIGLAVTAVCGVAVAGANAIVSMVIHFKMAHAFGRSDYFAVGLYFLNKIFTAILAFGEAKYVGPQKGAKAIAEQVEKEAREYARPVRQPQPVAQPVPQQTPERRQRAQHEEPQAYVRQPMPQNYAADRPYQQVRQTPPTDYPYQPRQQYQPEGQRVQRRAVRNAQSEE